MLRHRVATSVGAVGHVLELRRAAGSSAPSDTPSPSPSPGATTAPPASAAAHPASVASMLAANAVPSSPRGVEHVPRPLPRAASYRVVIDGGMVRTIRSLNRVMLYSHSEPLCRKICALLRFGVTEQPLSHADAYELVRMAGHYGHAGPAVVDAANAVASVVSRRTSTEAVDIAVALLALELSGAMEDKLSVNMTAVMQVIARKASELRSRAMSKLIKFASRSRSEIAPMLASIIDGSPVMSARTVVEYDLMNVLRVVMTAPEETRDATRHNLTCVVDALIRVLVREPAQLRQSSLETVCGALQRVGLPSDELEALLAKRRNAPEDAGIVRGDDDITSSRLRHAEIIDWLRRYMKMTRRGLSPTAAHRRTAGGMDEEVLMRGDEESMVEDMERNVIRSMREQDMFSLAKVVDIMANQHIQYKPFIEELFRLILLRREEWTLHNVGVTLQGLSRLRTPHELLGAAAVLRGAGKQEADIRHVHPPTSADCSADARADRVYTRAEVARALSDSAVTLLAACPDAGLPPAGALTGAALRDVELHGDGPEAAFAHAISTRLKELSFSEARIANSDASTIGMLLQQISRLPVEHAGLLAGRILRIRGVELNEYLRRLAFPPMDLVRIIVACAQATDGGDARAAVIGTCVDAVKQAAHGWQKGVNFRIAIRALLDLPRASDQPESLRRLPKLVTFVLEIVLNKKGVLTPGDALYVLELVCQCGVRLMEDLQTLATVVLDPPTPLPPVEAARVAARVLYGFATLGAVPSTTHSVCISRLRVSAPLLAFVDIVRILHACRVLDSRLHETVITSLLTRAAKLMQPPRVAQPTEGESAMDSAVSGDMANTDSTPPNGVVSTRLAEPTSSDPRPSLRAVCSLLAEARGLRDRKGSTLFVEEATLQIVYSSLRLAADADSSSADLASHATLVTNAGSLAPATAWPPKLTRAYTMQLVRVGKMVDAVTDKQRRALPLSLMCNVVTAIDRVLHPSFSEVQTIADTSDATPAAASSPHDAASQADGEPSSPEDEVGKAEYTVFGGEDFTIDPSLAGQLEETSQAIGELLSPRAGEIPALRLVDVACALSRAHFTFGGDITDQHARVRLQSPLLLSLRSRSADWLEMPLMLERLEQSGLLTAIKIRSAAFTDDEAPQPVAPPASSEASKAAKGAATPDAAPKAPVLPLFYRQQGASAESGDSSEQQPLEPHDADAAAGVLGSDKIHTALAREPRKKRTATKAAASDAKPPPARSKKAAAASSMKKPKDAKSRGRPPKTKNA